ncbi:hypothetical protein PSN45_003259 [Yamadazyma tenuis]|uniref:F-box domain-containing protein n=1 Tax=Candida tenuis (strain ATCC 10573 / BCRC 21748 / CBS 615 / JCM 9827 / NBRC 10315 / NRRL Y-1498 / VKM Y-70) TaxID=590646 RepID=G3AYV2_CANTC|nr:F-box domain-containing protein [Yamadazyma tenuis ATCC 10573]EGV65936.1 F-box domain-containing protein [Yamadazyma tenuis ATCC 10573]WEJ95732.1 hypothetical protein PSN45_003259 [Yamadazyma tenuis]
MKDSLGNDIHGEIPSIGESKLSIDHLPPELLVEIFSKLELFQLRSIRLVCKKWNSVVSDPIVWEKSFRTKFGNDEIFPSFSGTSSWLVEYLSRLSNAKRWKKAPGQHLTYQVINEETGHNDSCLTNFYSDRFLSYSRVNNNVSICTLHNGKNQTFIPGNHYAVRSYSVNWNYLVFGTREGGLYIKNLITSTSSGNRSSVKEVIPDQNGPEDHEIIESIHLSQEFDKNKVKPDIITGSSLGVVSTYNLDGALVHSWKVGATIIRVFSDFKKHIIAFTSHTISIIDYTSHKVEEVTIDIQIGPETIIDIDFGDNNIVICSENHIRVVDYSDPTIFIRRLDLGFNIKRGKLQQLGHRTRRDTSLVGKDGLYYANVLDDDTVIVWNVRESTETIKIRCKFQTEFKYKELNFNRGIPPNGRDRDYTVNAVELNSSVIIVGGFNGYCNVHDIFTGKFLRECSIKFPKKYPYMYNYQIPVKDIQLNERFNITNGIILCADLVQYFQFGDSDRDNTKTEKKKSSIGEAVKKGHTIKKTIKDQLDDYDLEEYKKDELNKMFTKYNGSEFSSQEELSIAIALSKSASSPEQGDQQDESESLRRALELSRNQTISTEESDDEELLRVLELSKHDMVISPTSLQSANEEEDEELRRILELSLADH